MALHIETRIEQWPLSAPFRITGYTFTSLAVLFLTCVTASTSVGRKAVGNYYRDDTPERMVAQIDAMRAAMCSGIDR